MPVLQVKEEQAAPEAMAAKAVQVKHFRAMAVPAVMAAVEEMVDMGEEWELPQRD